MTLLGGNGGLVGGVSTQFVIGLLCVPNFRESFLTKQVLYCRRSKATVTFLLPSGHTNTLSSHSHNTQPDTPRYLQASTVQGSTSLILAHGPPVARPSIL